MPGAQKTFDSLPDCEGRTLPFSIATAGATRIFESPSSGRVEVVEIFFQAVAANTVQVRVGSRNLTPVLDFSARMSYSDPGFKMDPHDGPVSLVLGSASQVVGFVRWRSDSSA